MSIVYFCLIDTFRLFVCLFIWLPVLHYTHASKLRRRKRQETTKKEFLCSGSSYNAYTCVKWRLKYTPIAFTIFSTISYFVIFSLVCLFNQLIVMCRCCCFCCCYFFDLTCTGDGGGISFISKCDAVVLFQLYNSMVMKWSL